MPNKGFRGAYSSLARQLLDVYAFFITLYESLQKVSAEIYSRIKEIPSQYEQPGKLSLIEKVFGHAFKQFSNI